MLLIPGLRSNSFTQYAKKFIYNNHIIKKYKTARSVVFVKNYYGIKTVLTINKINKSGKLCRIFEFMQGTSVYYN